jgi:hypothetical protein
MELILVLIFCVGIFILGTLYGWHLRERYATRMLQKLATHIFEEQVSNENTIQITVEKHNATLFIYRKEDGQFIAQGSSFKELNDALENRFPGKRFACSEEHLQIIKAL